MKPTVRAIAERAGVSVASVSMVLNDKPSRITEATKQKILTAASELGYDFKTKQKKLAKAPILGLVCPVHHHEYMNAYLKGIHRCAYVYGYKVITANIDESTEQALDYVKVFQNIGTAGIIMIPPADMNEGNHNTRLGQALQGTKRPFLLLDQAIDRVYCDFVTADNKGGAYMATEYMIHVGHRDIGVIAGKREAYTSRKRVEGYQEALAFYDLSITDENIYYGDESWQSGYKGMEYLDGMGIRAVFVCSDEMALGVYQYAARRQLKIGEELSVIAFHDSAAIRALSPALTTVNQPSELMGKKACEILIKRMTGEEKDEIRTTYFGPSLTERASVKIVNKV